MEQSIGLNGMSANADLQRKAKNFIYRIFPIVAILFHQARKRQKNLERLPRSILQMHKRSNHEEKI